MLVGAGLRGRVRVIASGKVVSGFSLVRNLALGADACNAARAMMFAIGCIQARRAARRPPRLPALGGADWLDAPAAAAAAGAQV